MIHLHSRSARSMHIAVNGLLGQIHDRIGDCFGVTEGTGVPVAGEYEAKCGCVRYTSLLAVAGQGSEVVRDVVSSVETELERSKEKGDPSSTDILRSPQVPLGPAQHIPPVVHDNISTLRASEQRTHLPSTGNSSTLATGVEDMDLHVSKPSKNVQLIPPTSEMIPTAESSDLSGDPETIVEPATADTVAPMSTPLRGENVIQRAVVPPIAHQDDHIRHLIREEIGRVLGAAIGSVSSVWAGPADLIRHQIRHALAAALESLAGTET